MEQVEFLSRYILLDCLSLIETIDMMILTVRIMNP